MTQPSPPAWISALLEPSVYPVATERVTTVETHISRVYLLDHDVFKVKKPLDLGFLDFSTLERRRHFCEEEVRLNRRLAPHVYHGVAPIRAVPDGAGGERFVVGEAGASTGDATSDDTISEDTVEFAVHMTRLPDAARLADRLAAGLVTDEFWARLGERLARFHAQAERSPTITEGATFARVAENARGNLIETARFVGASGSSAALGSSIDPELHARLERAIERSLATLRPAIEARAAAGVPCDTHGDLRLDHVYHFPDRAPPDDLVIIDCIEFSERFRHADPISDVAFLAMDLEFAGEKLAADSLIESYRRASGEQSTLFPWSIAYRSAVRAKIDHLTLEHSTLTPEARASLEERALGHWLLALGALEPPPARPALVLVGGPPGCGKSTVAAGLCESAGLEWIRSDEVRRELFTDGGSPDEDRYSEAGIARVYRECLDRADRVIATGGRALIDATFHRESPRRDAQQRAALRRIPCVFIELTIDRATAHARIASRRNDPSEADARVHDQLVAEWEEASEKTAGVRARVDASGGRERVLADALSVLEDRALA